MPDSPADAAIASARPTDPRLLVPLGLLTLYLIWGSTCLGIRFALESCPPFLLVGIRFSGRRHRPVWLPALARRGCAAPLQWRNAAFTGLLLLGLGNGLVGYAEQHVSSGIAAVAVARAAIAALFTGM